MNRRGEGFVAVDIDSRREQREGGLVDREHDVGCKERLRGLSGRHRGRVVRDPGVREAS